MIFIRIVQLKAFQALLRFTSANVFRSYLILSKFCPNWYVCMCVCSLVALRCLSVERVMNVINGNLSEGLLFTKSVARVEKTVILALTLHLLLLNVFVSVWMAVLRVRVFVWRGPFEVKTILIIQL